MENRSLARHTYTQIYTHKHTHTHKSIYSVQFGYGSREVTVRGVNFSHRVLANLRGAIMRSIHGLKYTVIKLLTEL